MTVKEIFVENLSKIRKGTTNAKLADIMGCSAANVSKYLNTESPQYASLMPDAAALVALCKYFNVSLDWLLGCNIPESDIQQMYTAADIMRALFWIEKYSDYRIEFEDANMGKILNSFIHQWYEIKRFCSKKGDLGDKTIALWKKDIIEKASNTPLVENDGLPFAD